MDIQLLQHNQIDKVKWDETVANSPRELPYFYSWYLDALHPDWMALTTVDYHWIFPLPINKILGLWPQLIQPLFIQQLGLIGRSVPEITTINAFLQKIPVNLAQVQISMMENIQINHDKGLGRHQKKGINQLLKMKQDDKTIFEGFSKSLKRNIRKNEDRFQELIPLKDPQAVAQFYKREINHMAKLKNEDYQRLNNVLKAGLQLNKVLLFELQTKEGDTASRGAYLLGKKRIINLVSSSDQKFKKWSPQTIMIHKVIKKYCQQYDLFDFEGSAIPGINSFFARFGSEEVYFPKIHWQQPLLKLVHKAKMHLRT